MDQYFNQMEKIVKERKTSSRIRFMLQDVIDLRLVSCVRISLCVGGAGAVGICACMHSLDLWLCVFCPAQLWGCIFHYSESECSFSVPPFHAGSLSTPIIRSEEENNRWDSNQWDFSIELNILHSPPHNTTVPLGLCDCWPIMLYTVH